MGREGPGRRTTALLGHPLADMVPQIMEPPHVATGNGVGVLTLQGVNGNAVNAGDLLPTAMMCLVVQHDDVLQAHQFRHDPLQHLTFGLDRLQRRAMALQQRAADRGDLQALAQLERMIVGQDDLGAVVIARQVGRQQFAMPVVPLRIVGQQHAQSVADGDARCHRSEIPARTTFC